MPIQHFSGATMPFKPPLTADDLATISQRYRPADEVRRYYLDREVWPDMSRLLWEVKRLRAMMLTAHQLRDNFSAPVGCLEMVYREFVRDLEAEPCVRELGEIKRELLDPDGKRRKVSANQGLPQEK